jgi:hypothetical protein
MSGLSGYHCDSITNARPPRAGTFPYREPTSYPFFAIAGQVANPPPGRLITFIPSEA